MICSVSRVDAEYPRLPNRPAIGDVPRVEQAPLAGWRLCRGVAPVGAGYGTPLKVGRFRSLARREKTMPRSSRSASRDVKRAMHRRKAGKLKSGRSGKTVKSKKQAIAIGLSEARAKGKKTPKKKSA